MEGIQRQLEDLLRERARLQQMRPPVPIALSLIDAEMMRLQSLVRSSSMLAVSNGDLANLFPYSAQGYLDPTAGKTCKSGSIAKKRLKLPIPANRYPDYNFVGRLLGPRGTTLKAMEKETGCKIMIRGKGSIRKDKEGDVRGKPGYEHVFSEPLHVVIEAEMEDNQALQALSRAKEEIEQLLVPVPEDRDVLKKQQLRDLAMINGTLRPSDSSPNYYGMTTQEYSADLNIPGISAVSSSDIMDELHFQLDDVALEDDPLVGHDGGGVGSVYGGSVHGGSVHGGSIHGGSVHGGSVHGVSIHGGSLYGGSIHGGSVHGGLPSGTTSAVGFPSPSGLHPSLGHSLYHDKVSSASESLLSTDGPLETSERIAIERRKPPGSMNREGWTASPIAPNSLFANSLPVSGQRSSSPAQWNPSSFIGSRGPGLWWGVPGPMSYQPHSVLSVHSRGGDSVHAPSDHKSNDPQHVFPTFVDEQFPFERGNDGGGGNDGGAGLGGSGDTPLNEATRAPHLQAQIYRTGDSWSMNDDRNKM